MTIRRTLIALLIALFTLEVQAQSTKGFQPLAIEVTGTNTIVLPAVVPTNRADWVAATAYTVGDYIRIITNNHTMHFWCTVSGTSAAIANEPLWLVNYTNATDIADGGALKWRWTRGPYRNAFTIINIGNTNISLSYGKNNPAVSDKGFILQKDGVGVHNAGYSDNPAWQGQVNAISPATGLDAVTVTIHEE